MSYIEQLSRTVESYLKSRTAIMRKFNDRKFTPSELEAIVDAPYNVLFRRRQNAAQWRSSELKLLAEALGMSSEGITGVQTLASQLQNLPNSLRGPLWKEARIDTRRLTVRRKDSDCWQCDELEHLAGVLRRWQDTQVAHNLLTSKLHKS